MSLSETLSSLLPSSRARTGGVRLLLDTSGIGGIERHVTVLTAALRRRGVDASILRLADHGDNPWLQQIDAAGIPHAVNTGGAIGLGRRLASEDVGLLHTHGYKAGILGRIVARALGIPVVSTFHAGETGQFPVNLYQFADEWTSALGVRIAVSPAIASRLPFSSHLIPNFIETPAKPTEAPLPAAIGFVGRLSHEKGPDLFCQVASRVKASVGGGSAMPWLVFGDGPMGPDLRRDFCDTVSFRGMVSDIGQAWREIGLLLMPSRAEGLPMAALEALAAGIPVASARVGAMPDVIRHGENGWLFDPGDIGAMRAIIGEWSQRRGVDSTALRRAAWRTAREAFGVESGLDRTLEAYRDAGFTAV